MLNFRLANILLDVEEHLEGVPELLYRAKGKAVYCSQDRSLEFEGSVDFLTYFNGVSCGKWRRYAGIEEVGLHLELAGDACSLKLLGVKDGAVRASDAPDPSLNNAASVVAASVEAEPVHEPISFEGAVEYREVEVTIPTEGLLLGGFELESSGSTRVRNAYWYAVVDENRVRPVRLAVATTTFKKEEYIVPNIQAVKEQVLACDEPIAEAFHLFVVDNGQTLSVSELSDAGVTILPNANTGGAGGFARGMMAALGDESGFTHVLLMDDDVRMSPESFKRTFNLLSLAKDEYAGAFINGAMLQLERPNMQFEDVSFVRTDGAYERCKGNLFMDNLADVAVNEVISVERDQAYGAWWYACIPLSVVRAKGLPLPLFVRCDDVEYGMRCEPLYMTMNGICVWHEGFGGRFRASVDCYQYIRNYLIMVACDGKSDERMFLLRAARTFRIYLRSMAYDTAELIVSGFEDYLKGPEFLMAADGEGLMKRNGAMNEKLLPIPQALELAVEEDPALSRVLKGFSPDAHVLSEDGGVSILLKIWRTLPYDKHMLPDVLLRKKPATIFYGGTTVASASQFCTSVLVACDREGENAHVRTMDRGRYRSLKRRWKAAKADHVARGKEVARSYREAMSEMTSYAFWMRYLGL